LLYWQVPVKAHNENSGSTRKFTVSKRAERQICKKVIPKMRFLSKVFFTWGKCLLGKIGSDYFRKPKHKLPYSIVLLMIKSTLKMNHQKKLKRKMANPFHLF